MDAVEKRNLSKEAQMQMNALKKIGLWRNIAFAVSTLGVAIAYAGLAGMGRNLFLGILGIVLILAGFASAILFNLGIKNGKRNVEKILNLLEQG